MFKDHSLMNRLVVPIIALAIVLLIASNMFIASKMHQQAIDNAIDGAEINANQFKALRGYYAKNVIAKVLAASDIKPSVDHANTKGSIPLPATMIHDLSEQFSKLGTQVKLYSPYPFPNRKSRQVDKFGNKAWAALESDIDGIYTEVEESGDKTFVRVGVPDTMQAQSCVNCHNNHPLTPKANWQLNDLRGVLEINVDISEQLAAVDNLSFVFSIGLVIAFIILIATVIVIFRHFILRRLVDLRCAIHDVSKGTGDLTLRLKIESKDEIGDVCDQFNTLMQELHDLISDIIKNTKSISVLSGDVAKYSRQNNDGLDKQRQDIGEVETSLNTMMDSITEVVNSTQQAAEVTLASQDISNSGNVTVSNTVKDIGKMSDSIESAAQVIDQLAQDSEKISSVLEVIKGIADQTNLLALNAAIEAARAGDQGRGFAVVADEVRGLAGRTQQSVNDINEMIEKLQSATANAVEAITQGRSLAEKAVVNAEEAGKSLGAVSSSIQTIAEMNTKVASEAEQQLTMATSVVGNIASINNNTSEIGEVSREMTSNGDEMAEATQSLYERVSRLKT